MLDSLSLLVGMVVTAILLVSLHLYRQYFLRGSKGADLQAQQAVWLEQVKEAAAHAMNDSVEKLVLLSHEAYRSQSEQADRLMGQRQQAIDHSFVQVGEELTRLRELVHRLEKEREAKLGELSVQLRSTSEITLRLQDTTADLQRALSSSQKRGQWGERMAEDVLRAVGLHEGINFVKQQSLPDGRGRPDYTFLLPGGLVLHMDVKFPFENYYRWLQSEDAGEREQLKGQFLRDVRQRIREVSSKGYVSREHDTVDYALLFIPNEQVYALIQEMDMAVVDEALASRVILCSPLTLYAMLALIRKALDTFKLQTAASEVLELLASFTDQWDKFVEGLERVGRRLEEAQKEYGLLVTTRRRQLERQLERVQAAREKP